jgi:hypothetical protein
MSVILALMNGIKIMCELNKIDIIFIICLKPTLLYCFIVMSDIGLNIDILTKIGTIIYEDTYGDVWFKLMTMSDEFNLYAKSPVGITQFMDFSERVVLVDDGETNTVMHTLFEYIHRNHSDDLPAVIIQNQHYGYTKLWYKRSIIHRDNDLPAKICEHNNLRAWFKNGSLHRDNGPAIIDNDCELWYEYDVEIKKV